MKVNLKEMARHVVADKLFGRLWQEEFQKCWLLKSVSANIARKLESKSELVTSLQELFKIEDDDNDDNTSN